jgi:hypothetical protein
MKKLFSHREVSPLERTLQGTSWHSASFRLIEGGQWRPLMRCVVQDLGKTFAALLNELGDVTPPEEASNEDLIAWLEHPPATRDIALILLRATQRSYLNRWECNRLLDALELVDECARGSGDSQPRPIAPLALRLFVSAELAAAVVRRQVQR